MPYGWCSRRIRRCWDGSRRSKLPHETWSRTGLIKKITTRLSALWQEKRCVNSLSNMNAPSKARSSTEKSGLPWRASGRCPASLSQREYGAHARVDLSVDPAFATDRVRHSALLSRREADYSCLNGCQQRHRTIRAIFGLCLLAQCKRLQR